VSDYSLDALKANPVTTTLDTAFNLANAARDGLCTVYRNAPWALTYGEGGFDPTGLGGAFRRTLDNVCSDKDLPPLPPSPGGGLCNVRYRVEYVTRSPDSGGTIQESPGVIFLFGPIGGVAFEKTPGLANSGRYYIPNDIPTDKFVLIQFPTTGPTAGKYSAQITAISPVTPGTDICGQADRQFPPRLPAPDEYGGNRTYRDRGIDITVPFKVPPIIIPPGAVQVNPTLVVKIGKVEVNFDLSGASVNFNFGGGPGGSVGNPGGSNPNDPVQNPADGIDPELLADRFDRIEDLLKELEDCACKPDPSSGLVVTPGTEAAGQCIALSVTRNRYCAIAVTQAPPNQRIQFGNNSPDVVYAGWAWFKGGDFLFERFPIDAQGKLYANPGKASAFCYSMNAGFKGKPFMLDAPLE